MMWIPINGCTLYGFRLQSKHFSCPKGKSKESAELKKRTFLKKYGGVVWKEKSLDNMY